MSDERSAWDRYPGYRVDLLPCHSTGRIEYQGNIIAHSDSCLLVKESEHDTRLYFPEADVNWDYFEPSTHQTFCPFKGEASYWSLQSKDEAAQNVVWTYRQPLTEVEGLRGYVSFDTDKLKVELVQNWSGDADHAVVTSFPVWGDAADLQRLQPGQRLRARGAAGIVIIARGKSVSDIEALITADPFHMAGVAKYRITEFDPSNVAAALK